MRVLLQRVARAKAMVESAMLGSIGAACCCSSASHTPTRDDELDWMADKVVGLRIFADDEDKMNRSVADVGGAMLVVSQFTLYGDAVKGAGRASSTRRGRSTAIPLYERFVALLRERGVPVETGEFGATMQVELVNDGPVTLWLER